MAAARKLRPTEEFVGLTCVGPIRTARSVSGRRSVARKASTPCSQVRSLTAQNRPVPHRQRSRSWASCTRLRGPGCRDNGNDSWHKVQTPEIFMTTLSGSAVAGTLGRSANGSGGAGGTKVRASPTWSMMTWVSWFHRARSVKGATCPRP